MGAGIAMIVLVFVVLAMIVAIGPPSTRPRRSGGRVHDPDGPYSGSPLVWWSASGEAGGPGADGGCGVGGGGDGGSC